MRKPTVCGPGAVSTVRCVDERFSGQFPEVWHYLSDTAYDDGSPRVVATLLVFTEGPCVKVCLSDRDVARKVFVTADGFYEALEALERALVADAADWRADRPKAPSASKSR